ncbi:hypothetical protein VSS74_22740 [Conexibacter stalactiti]|uniref:Ion transport domain-containing protein n=1 Tax=Conexibacter stalactiti TaxID=1940611 RepID=A0ABU4HV48_9ACTN|nr:hypothetical protein [Conexibacter stalactiti]MDW5597182.1 hypothetical protein [Conexibacter stalactiti]MEC5037824.1 hypothetical protein [Conexibacter stalactiti]
MTEPIHEPDQPDLRAERWERRLTPLVIGAAIAVLPLLALSLARPHGALHDVETIGHWVVWLLFFAEAAIMLTVSRDKLGWASSHRFELVVVVVSSPLLPLALAAAPALRLLVVAKAFKALKLAKVIKLGKLGKSIRLLRRRLRLGPRAELVLSAVGLSLAIGLVAYILTDEAPLEDLGNTLALLALGLLITTCVAHLHRRATRRG